MKTSSIGLILSLVFLSSCAHVQNENRVPASNDGANSPEAQEYLALHNQYTREQAVEAQTDLADRIARSEAAANQDNIELKTAINATISTELRGQLLPQSSAATAYIDEHGGYYSSFSTGDRCYTVIRPGREYLRQAETLVTVCKRLDANTGHVVSKELQGSRFVKKSNGPYLVTPYGSEN